VVRPARRRSSPRLPKARDGAPRVASSSRSIGEKIAMKVVGRITKQETPWWSAEVPAIGAFTQGSSRRDAVAMLKDLIKTMIDRKGFEVAVKKTRTSADGVVIVSVQSNRPRLLAQRVRSHHRELGWAKPRIDALVQLLTWASKPPFTMTPIPRLVDTRPVRRCKTAKVPPSALRTNVTDLCRRARIPILATVDRHVYVYRGRRKIRTLAFDLVGVPVSPRSRMGALRALESLAYKFHDHFARYCVVGRRYFTTRSRK
jgi:predicted RNase H-like HicB family nuclease